MQIYLSGTVARKVFNTREAVDSIPYDHDENKYQRRGAVDWFARWFWWVETYDSFLNSQIITITVTLRITMNEP